MAGYYGDYHSDCGQVFQRVPLEAYFVDVTVGTRGTRSYTSEADDRALIPGVWFSHVQPRQRRAAYCKMPHRARYALIWVSESRYLHVDVPFLPNSTEYNQFFLSLAFDFAGQTLTIGSEGELINPEWLQVCVSR